MQSVSKEKGQLFWLPAVSKKPRHAWLTHPGSGAGRENLNFLRDEDLHHHDLGYILE
jgi:hypothetical protein